jgi:hypothetical protein
MFWKTEHFLADCRRAWYFFANDGVAEMQRSQQSQGYEICRLLEQGRGR